MKRKSIFLAIIAICIAFFTFFGGCSTSDEWVRKTIEKNYYRFDGDYSGLENMKGLSIEEMMERLDIYSAYYTEEEYEKVYADNSGSKSGVGVSYSFTKGKGIELHSVIGNSPAKKAGLKAGDVIVSASVSQDEEIIFSEHENTFADFIDARADGEKFSLNLSDGRQVTLAKSAYTASYACMYTKDKTFDIEYSGDNMSVSVDGEGGISKLPEGAAYIYLYQFYGGAYAETARLISEFNAENCTSLILDLRGNGGGYVELMCEIGGLFTSRLGGSHVAMRAKYKSGKEEVSYCFDIPQGNPLYGSTLPAGTPVYLLANDNTASASEALIGILVSYDILKYENIFLSKYGDLPARSYGKGIMQSVFTNFNGERLKLTIAGIYWPNGKTIHGVGLTESDGCAAAPSKDGIVNVGYDDELECVIRKIQADRNFGTEEIAQ